MEVDEKILIVQPRTTYLSLEDLISRKNANVIPDNAANTNQLCPGEKEMESLYACLRVSISSSRIERLGGRSLAIWKPEICMAHVIRKDGKYDIFGTTIDKQLYLEYFETLYLVEMGRLQLQYHGRLLSIEQAYLLLLGEETSKKYNEYLVYAQLARAGYILVRYKNKHFQLEFIKDFQPTEIDCIWAWLLDANRKSIPNSIKETKMYANIKGKIESIRNRIIMQQSVEEVTQENSNSNSNEQSELGTNSNKIKDQIRSESPPTCSPNLVKSGSRKRRPDDNMQQPESKVFCHYAHSYLDSIVENAADFKKFANTFKNLDIVKITLTKQNSTNKGCYGTVNEGDDGDSNSNDEDEDENGIFSFDLYLHSNNFKKSTLHPPLMRILVLSASEVFPNHLKITNYFRSLYHPTPILIVSVGDAKQIQAFLYFFS